MSGPTKATLLALEERSGGTCEGCGGAPATEVHHRKFRSRGGLHNLGNLLHLCGWGNHTGCHGRAHSADPPEGWAVHSWDDPLLTPVIHAREGLTYLTNMPAAPFGAVGGIPEF